MTCNHQWQEAGTSLKPEWACTKCKVLYTVLKRMGSVEAAMATNPYRDQVIEEVAQHVEKLTGFGADTVSGLAIYIREMKK